MSPTLTAPGGAGRSPQDVPVQRLRLLPGGPPPSGRGSGAAGSEDPEAAAEGGHRQDAPLPVLRASEGRRWRGAVDKLPGQPIMANASVRGKICRLHCLVCCMSVLALCQLGQVFKLMIPQCTQPDPHNVEA